MDGSDECVSTLYDQALVQHLLTNWFPPLLQDANFSVSIHKNATEMLNDALWITTEDMQQRLCDGTLAVLHIYSDGSHADNVVLRGERPIDDDVLEYLRCV